MSDQSYNFGFGQITLAGTNVKLIPMSDSSVKFRKDE